MEEQKKFKKKSLNRNDYKGAEKGAKVMKGLLGVFGAIAFWAINKDKPKR